MDEYLLFRLYGPLASWGTIAVGQERPSDVHPSKSAILGMIAAALGLRRDDDRVHREMAQGYGMAVRIDVAGISLRDYHTIQVPPQRHKVVHYTRADELRSTDRNTILSAREYRCDALYTIALWMRPAATPPQPLGKIADALRRPGFVLFLGRKSCPPAIPLEPSLVSAASLEEAFAGFNTALERLLHPLTGKALTAPQICWDEDADSVGLTVTQTQVRRDSVLSRSRWQFTTRRERIGRSTDGDTGG